MEGSHRPLRLAFTRHQVSITVDIETGAGIDPSEARWLARVGADAARVAVAEALDRAGVAAAVTGVSGVSPALTPDRRSGGPVGCDARGSEAVA